MSLTAAERTQNLRKIAVAAVATEVTSGIPAELSTAQCILESGWLEFAPGGNPFGIKAYEGGPGRQLLDTTEWFTPAELEQFLASGDGRIAVATVKNGVPNKIGKRTQYRVKDWFAKFPSLTDAFKRHAATLLQGLFYRQATKQFQSDRNLSAYIEAIAKYYATSPTYASQVEQLIAQNNVKAALKNARA
jgi:flagellum-specific peptidoglycan hydrolase FlgJ